MVQNIHFATTTKKMDQIKYQSYISGFIAGAVGMLIALLIF